MSGPLTKQELRTSARSLCGLVDDATTRAVCDRLRGVLPSRPMPGPRNAVMLYAAMPGKGEVEVSSLAPGLWAIGARVCVPRVDWSGADGVMTPVLVSDFARDLRVDPARPGLGAIQPAAELPAIDVRELCAIVVPGLAFDRSGGRLGRGGGFYDRFLARVRSGGASGATLVIGVVPEARLVERVPMEAHDQPMDVVVTELNVYRR